MTIERKVWRYQRGINQKPIKKYIQNNGQKKKYKRTKRFTSL